MEDNIREEIDNNFALQLEKAEKGEPNAQYFVGRAYLTGDGIQKDESIGSVWVFKAAHNGQIDAVTMIKSLKDEVNKEKVNIKYLFKLGISCAMYAADSGEKEAIEIRNEVMHKAEVENNPDMQFLLSILYSKGISFTKDMGQCYVWLSKAAMNGQEEAIVILHKLNKSILERFGAGVVFFLF
jgi:TPR repeat protein